MTNCNCEAKENATNSHNSEIRFYYNTHIHLDLYTY